MGSNFLDLKEDVKLMGAEATIFSVEEGIFENIATVHNEELGAERFVVEYMINPTTIEGKESMPLVCFCMKVANASLLVQDTDLMSLLKVQVERAKIFLSIHTSIGIEVKSFRTKLSGKLSVSRPPPNIRLQANGVQENINNVLFRRTMNLIDVVIRKADNKLNRKYGNRVNKSSINRVIVSGGGANMPRVGKVLESHLGKAPTDYHDISPEHAVVIGAAKRAQVLQSNARHGGEYCTSLLDLAPLPLGVETAGGIVTDVSGGTGSFPFKKNIVFTTEVDGQKEIAFRVLEGLSMQARYNKILGAFKIQVSPAPKGVAHVSQPL